MYDKTLVNKSMVWYMNSVFFRQIFFHFPKVPSGWNKVVNAETGAYFETKDKSFYEIGIDI